MCCDYDNIVLGIFQYFNQLRYFYIIFDIYYFTKYIKHTKKITTFFKREAPNLSKKRGPACPPP